MKYIGTYSNDADIATKAKVDAKQDKVLVDGILQGDGAGTISAAETQEVELVTLTKADVGLDNVDNTSDANKPISTATQAALNGKQATITGGASTITSSNLTANRALVSDASGKVAVSAVTSTELGYLDGVTSNIQTQLNGKLSTAPVTSVNGATGATKSTFYITAIKDGDNLTVDKTLEEVYEAYTAGYAVYANYSDSIGPYVGTLPLQAASPNSVEFKSLIYVSDTTVIAAELVCTESEWTSNVYAVPTQTYVDSKQSIIIDNGFLYGNGAGRVTTEKPVFTVTITPTEADSSTGTADKTPGEILAAYNAGYTVQALCQVPGANSPVTLTLVGIAENADVIGIVFSASVSVYEGELLWRGWTVSHLNVGNNWQIYKTDMVPTTRTINNKSLSYNIALNAADVKAVGLTGDQIIAGDKTFSDKATFDGEVNFSNSTAFNFGTTFGGGIVVNGGSKFTGQQSFNDGMVVGGPTQYKENSAVDFSNATVTGLSGLLPTVATSDNGKFLRVVNGAWAAATVENANGVSF